jgi:hypothetical protein
MMGRYSFQLPEIPGGLRPLRDLKPVVVTTRTWWYTAKIW